MKKLLAIVCAITFIFTSFVSFAPQTFASDTEPVMVKDIKTGIEGSWTEGLTDFNNTLYFKPNDADANRNEL